MKRRSTDTITMPESQTNAESLLPSTELVIEKKSSLSMNIDQTLSVTRHSRPARWYGGMHDAACDDMARLDTFEIYEYTSSPSITIKSFGSLTTISKIVLNSSGCTDVYTSIASSK